MTDGAEKQVWFMWRARALLSDLLVDPHNQETSQGTKSAKAASRRSTLIEELEELEELEGR